MKILHAAETIKGGVATVLNQLINNPQHSSDEISCMIPEEQKQELTVISCNQYYFQHLNRGFKSNLNFIRKFFKLVWIINPDIVHLHSSFAGVLGRIALIILYPFRRPKVVYCPHAFSFLMAGSEAKRKIYILIEKILLIRTNKIICVSDNERNEAIKHGFPETKLTLIYNGVPVPQFDINLRLPFEYNQKINLLFIGRFDYQKGFDILLTLMKNIDAACYHLTAIGDFVHEQDAFIEHPKDITFTGWLNKEQIKPYLQYADVIIVPSRWEGFAMVPIEAMSYKKPIIAANTTSLPEAVLDGYNGYLFDIHNIESLTYIVSNLDKKNLVHMGKNGYDRYLHYFDSSIMLNKTAQLYNDLLAK